MYEYEKQHRDNNSQKKKVKSKTSKYQIKDDNILQLKPLNSSSSVARKITIKVPSNISDRSMGSGTVIQRTEATVYVTREGNRREYGTGGRARGGIGGVDHAEQQAWGERAQNAVRNAIEREAGKRKRDRQPVLVEFEIDELVCLDCQEWFEGTFWNTIQRLIDGTEVVVNISITVPPNTIRLTGPGTAWGNVGMQP